jgi:DNA (cytosine-5)-methyltransferase 1
MENVPGLEGQNVFHQFVSNLKSNGYSVDYKVINCAQYGIPQKRHRLVLLASKLGPLVLLTPEQFGNSTCSVMEAISELPPIRAGSTHPDDPLHRSSRLSDINLRRIKASKPGGTWRDWPDELLVECHKKATGMTYSSVYGRMSWDEPSPTITTQFYGYGNGRFGDPEQDRAISLREGAILQSFPIDYKFARPGDPIHQRTIGRLIGNAVPVTLGEVIGVSLLMHVSSSIYKGYQRGLNIGNRNDSN